MNFPADVRKNLKGIVLPEDSEEERGTRGEARSGVKSRGEGKTSLETLDFHPTCIHLLLRELTHLVSTTHNLSPL